MNTFTSLIASTIVKVINGFLMGIGIAAAFWMLGLWPL